MSAVDSPIFLIGTGRCGSSLLYRLLGYHPDVAWISHYTSYLPGGGAWAALARVHDLPGMADWLPKAEGTRRIPQPTENYRLLNAATDGLFTAPRELTADDMTDAARERLRALVASHATAQGKPRFAMKHTGFPRVDYLRAAFPDAKFVHMRRDGRAVAASLCRVDWWSGEGQWGWGAVSPEDQAIYRESGSHELVLAAIYWKVLMRQYDAVVAPADQLLELRYDAMVADPIGTMRALADFVELPWGPVFERRLTATPMTSDDRKWRRGLTPEEVGLLERVLHDDLVAQGFTP
jgi:hypothetical protein